MVRKVFFTSQILQSLHVRWKQEADTWNYKMGNHRVKEIWLLTKNCRKCRSCPLPFFETIFTLANKIPTSTAILQGPRHRGAGGGGHSPPLFCEASSFKAAVKEISLGPLLLLDLPPPPPHFQTRGVGHVLAILLPSFLVCFNRKLKKDISLACAVPASSKNLVWPACHAMHSRLFAVKCN